MTESMHLKNFLSYLNSFAEVSEELKSKIGERIQYRIIRKGEVYIKKGGYDKVIGFLSEGNMRIYEVDRQGQDWNKVLLTYQTILLGNTDFNKPSIHYIDAITECQIIELPVSAFKEMLINFSELREIQHKVLSKIYQMKSERESDLLLLNTKERYLKLVENLGNSLLNIPQYHIASYLGVTPIQLSRIKSSIRP